MTTAHDDRLSRAAALHTFTVGDHRLTYLPDGIARIDPRIWLPDADELQWGRYRALIDEDGYLAASVGAVLIEYGDRAMLIDAGFGPLAIPTAVGTLRGGELLTSLAAAGKSLEDVELVALTHLHMDHIGWLCQTIPHTGATFFSGIPVIVGAAEWARPDLAIADNTPPQALESFASQIRTVTDDEIFPGVAALPLPGHSLGHTGYLLTSAGQRLIMVGDALTSPIQVEYPELTSAADDDPAQSQRTAEWLIRELARPDTQGFGMHFADVQLGRVATVEGRQQWVTV